MSRKPEICLLLLTLLCGPLPYWIRMTWVTNRIVQKWPHVIFKLIKSTEASILLSVQLLTLGKASPQNVRTFSVALQRWSRGKALRLSANSHMNEPRCERTLQAQASLQLTAAPTDIFTTTLETPRARPTQLGHSQIPNLQELWEKIYVYSYFKAWRSGITYYEAIGN